jgi:hypothetical protein
MTIKFDNPEKYILHFTKNKHGFDFTKEVYFVGVNGATDADDNYLHRDGTIRKGTNGDKQLPDNRKGVGEQTVMEVFTGFFENKETALKAINDYHELQEILIDEGDMMIVEGTAIEIQGIANGKEMSLYKLDSLYPSGRLIDSYDEGNDLHRAPEYAAVFWKK